MKSIQPAIRQEVTRDLLNLWIHDAYTIAMSKGFHNKPLNKPYYLMLIVTEISEAIDADRKKRHVTESIPAPERNVDSISIMDEADRFTPNRRTIEWLDYFERNVKNTFEDEMADIIIRCCDFLGAIGITEVPVRNFSYSHPYPDVFGELGWYWECLLHLENHPIEERLTALINAVCDYCNLIGIDIVSHVWGKMIYNIYRIYPEQI